MASEQEDLFHQYFQQLSPEDRQRYGTGRNDLKGHPLEPLLHTICKAFNAALQNETRDIPEHKAHPPFYFDYVESDIPNALAFRYGNYSFIGVSVPLINLMLEVSFQLSRSAVVARVIGLTGALPEICDPLQSLLFTTQLNLVMAHEYTHHVHGHCTDQGKTEGIERQAQEADADGYAVYHVLANLFDGSGRLLPITELRLELLPASKQDEVLLSSVVVSSGAAQLVWPARELDNESIYSETHPSEAARMSMIMQQALLWCKKFRPDLEPWMTLERFQTLMNCVAQAIGGSDWKEQTEFLRSENGTEYFRKLDKSLKAHIQSL